MDRRNIVELKYDWKFSRIDAHGFEDPNFDDRQWETVRIPHDWAIYGPFHKKNDSQVGRILEDGEQEDLEHTGRTGGLPHVGMGYYRKNIHVPEENRGKVFRLEFDGVMSNSTVYVNGAIAGGWPYGYTSFSLDITDLIVAGEENSLCVSVRNDWNASRWYPGAGIYRNVRLLTLDPVHIQYNGVSVGITMTGDDSAVLNPELEINGSVRDDNIFFEYSLRDVDGAELSFCESDSPRCSVNVKGIKRWDLDNPHLYTLRSLIRKGDEVVDLIDTRIGFREFEFDKDKGFFLNGEHRKFNGVCMHHDLGALGSAVNRRALERQLEILKSFGTNALRTSHNPPTPELLDLCDEMGILVMDEIFDEWRTPKVKNGYAHLWHDWAEKDLTALIKRDRNHPSVIIWSIGNEIPDQMKPDGVELTRYLYDFCKKLDPSRPVTSGFNNPHEAIKNGLADVVDLPGWNYKPHLYEKFRKEHPDYIMIGAETSSTVSSRGVYHFPVKMEVDTLHEDKQVSSYDLYAPPWANVVETEFALQRKHEYMSGEFVWTGFDYLGEPTPYKVDWPSRSSYFGIVDLCGFPKDRYYMYAAEWGDQPVLHLLPHWNWSGRDGENTPVICITTYEKAELFLNGKSLGMRVKGEFAADKLDFSEDEGKIRHGEKAIYLKDHISDYRLVWDDVPYEPGELKVVAYDNSGNRALEKIIETTSSPFQIVMSSDRQEINSDGDDLAFITLTTSDESGRFVPTADNQINFSISGPGELIALDNGDASSLELFQGTSRKVFSGMCLAIVRSIKDQPGEIRLTAQSEGLISSEIKIAAKVKK